MRFLEVLSCLLMLPSMCVMLLGARTAHREARVICLLLIMALVAHVIAEGVHWQMFPAYLAACLIVLCTLLCPKLPIVAIRGMGVGCLLLIVLAGLLSYLLPMFRLPKPTGKYAIGTQTLHLVDARRADDHGVFPGGRRGLMVQMWYPAQPSGNKLAVYRNRKETTFRSSYQSVLRTHSHQDAPLSADQAAYPVLLFNPAWTGQRTQSTFLMEELASHGFVVVSIDHTYYSGLVAFPGGQITDSRFAPDIGNFENSSIAEQRSLGGKYVRIEAEDDIFVLDRLQAMNADPASEWHGRLDMNRVGALGHSIGGAVAMQAAFMDQRIKAALNMDGWVFDDVAHQGLAKPLMLIYEGKDQIDAMRPVPGTETPAQQRYWAFDDEDQANINVNLRQHGEFRLSIEGTSHWNFTDRALYSPLRRWSAAGPIQPDRGYSIIDAYVRAFFAHSLNGADEPLLQQSPSPFSEVKFTVWQQALASHDQEAR